MTATSGQTVGNKIFDSGDPLNGATEIFGYTVNGAIVSQDWFQNAHYGLKIGTGGVSQNIYANGLTFQHLAEPMLLAQVHGGEFDNITIQAGHYATTNQWHGIYMERDNHNLTFNNLTIKGGSGYCLP